ncbi:MAG TPA: ethanolamine ammonia-lyase subunit EutC [Methylococcaceae bacterium]|jgi:ethanolamine ammonia-lyase small subunit|nr:ethanolamine ammonia-lyase subunit EutC [Methylococcaceae bacterium]
MNDPWQTLRQFTQARIAQGRAGYGIRTSSMLDFQLAHALARDAVHLPWDVEAFAQGVKALRMEPITLSTLVRDRMQYLKRPDLGRVLDQASRVLLDGLANPPIEVALTFSNGLSSTAIQSHGLNLLQAIVGTFNVGLLPGSTSGPNESVLKQHVAIGPVCLVPNARVALSDEIGALLKARISIIVVGERPGLSASDSLGIYMTYNPHPANTDAERNCISNIRPPDGMSCEDAAAKLFYLCRQAVKRRLSGVALKDDMSSIQRLDIDSIR